MNTTILRFGTRAAARHPGDALRVSALAVRYRRAIMAAAEAAATLKESAANPRARAEARLAVSSLVLAGKRARKIGIADATSDGRVMAQLRQARRHAGRAVTTTRRARRRQRVIRATRIIAGAGALGGAAYVGWKVRAEPEPAAHRTPASPPTDTTAAV